MGCKAIHSTEHKNDKSDVQVTVHHGKFLQ